MRWGREAEAAEFSETEIWAVQGSHLPELWVWGLKLVGWDSWIPDLRGLAQCLGGASPGAVEVLGARGVGRLTRKGFGSVERWRPGGGRCQKAETRLEVKAPR